MHQNQRHTGPVHAKVRVRPGHERHQLLRAHEPVRNQVGRTVHRPRQLLEGFRQRREVRLQGPRPLVPRKPNQHANR